MGRNRFVEHKTKRIDISDGDWIEVKEQLNIGEQLDVEGAGIEISQKPGEREATYSMSRPGDAAVTRLAVWLSDWSLHNSDGKKIAVSKDSVGKLDEDTFAEIRKALDVHVTGIAASRKDAEAEASKPKN